MEKRSINILTAFFVLVVLAAVYLHFGQRQRLKAEIAGYERISALKVTKAEIDYINADLNRRAAGDCKLTREVYGFSCREFKTDKLYRIYTK